VSPLKIQALHALLRTLWRKEVYIKTETRQFTGPVIFVGKLTPTGTPYLSVQDSFTGKQKVMLKEMRQVWLRNKCLWRATASIYD
jgi:hypothetical protein